jgi:hypothetical protein
MDGHLGLTAPPPALIVGGEHLTEILGLERLTILGYLPGGPQAQLFGPGPGEVLAQQPHPEHESCNGAQQHDRKGIHSVPSLT